MPPLKYTLPTFLFFSLCGFYFIIYQMEVSDAPARFLAAHEASHVPLNLTGGRIPLLDSLLRPLISFFVSAFEDPHSSSFDTVVAFVWSFSSAIQLPLVESLRTRRGSSDTGPREESWLSKTARIALSQPMIWGILYQRFSGGFIIPIWLFFFLNSETHASGGPVPQIEAEGALVGWWLGHTLPALILLIPNLPPLCGVPTWIAFPILMSGFRKAYLYLRRGYDELTQERTDSESERRHNPLQLMYGSAMLVSFVAHFHVVLVPALTSASPYEPTPNDYIDKNIGLMQKLRSFFFSVFTSPSFGLLPPAPAETTEASGVLHFVQCDVIIVFSAIWVALLWDLAMRRPSKSAKKTVSWLIITSCSLLIGSLLLSPGTTTGYLMMCREEELEDGRTNCSSRSHYDSPTTVAMELEGGSRVSQVDEKYVTFSISSWHRKSHWSHIFMYHRNSNLEKSAL